jgi:hypothetical protein
MGAGGGLWYVVLVLFVSKKRTEYQSFQIHSVSDKPREAVCGYRKYIGSWSCSPEVSNKLYASPVMTASA